MLNKILRVVDKKSFTKVSLLALLLTCVALLLLNSFPLSSKVFLYNDCPPPMLCDSEGVTSGYGFPWIFKTEGTLSGSEINFGFLALDFLFYFIISFVLFSMFYNIKNNKKRNK
ncbi:MAG: hypothetical protein Q7S53_00875 [bacterium]|nr:hypothetical protein [bacterium]